MAEAQVLSALVRIPIDQVEPGPNARGDVGDVGELALSIRALGMQKPLLVCALGSGRYQVLDGHRRLSAAQLLELSHVDAVVRRDAGPATRIKQQLAIHTQAKSFDPIAEAKALSELMFAHGMSREQIAEAVGRTPGWVRDRIALLQLADDEQRDVRLGRMTLSEAAAMLSHRRAVQDGRWSPAPRPARKPAAGPVTEPVRPSERHCSTCRCREVPDA